MFDAMRDAFQEEVVGYLFHIQIQTQDLPTVGARADDSGQAVDAKSLLAAGSTTTKGGSSESSAGHRRGRPVRRQGTAKSAARAAEPATPAGGVLAGRAASRPAQMTYTAPNESGEAEQVDTLTEREDDPYAGIGRNEPCPCGSGKKFKNCHGRNPNIH